MELKVVKFMDRWTVCRWDAGWKVLPGMVFDTKEEAEEALRELG